MTRTPSKTTSLLLCATALGTAVALAACCKSKTEEEAAPTAPEPSAAAPAAEPAAAEATGPEWKQKCPDAERQESGTVTVVGTQQIYKQPDTNSEKLSTIATGTWVNLLGAKSTWLCIDYPCGVGQLCPGWVLEANTQRKQPEAVKDAGVDAPVADAAPEDAAPEAAATDAGRRLPIIIPPRLDAGAIPTGKLPPGGRPPGPATPK